MSVSCSEAPPAVTFSTNVNEEDRATTTHKTKRAKQQRRAAFCCHVYNPHGGGEPRRQHVHRKDDNSRSSFRHSIQLERVLSSKDHFLEHSFRKVWKSMIAVMAFLECVSFCLPYIFIESDGGWRSVLPVDTFATSGRGHHHHHQRQRQKGMSSIGQVFRRNRNLTVVPHHQSTKKAAPEQCKKGGHSLLFQDVFFAVVIWFQSKRNTFSLAFSLLCFVDAFVKAVEAQVNNTVIDRQKSGMDDDSHSPKSGARVRSWFSVVVTLSCRLLLLPISFYVFWGGKLGLALLLQGNNEKFKRVEGAEHSRIKTGDSKFALNESVIIHHSTLPYVSIDHTKYCYPYAITVYAISVLSEEVRMTVKRYALTLLFKFVPRLAKFAIFRPRLFRHRTEQILLFLRWFRYLFPIFDDVMRVHVSALDLVKRSRQHIQAARARSARRRHWTKMDENERVHLAAIIIQRNYRSLKSCRFVRLVRETLRWKQETAALRMQRILRSKIAQERMVIHTKKEELRGLRMSQYLARPSQRFSLRMDGLFVASDAQNIRDYQRIQELQTELKTIVKGQKKRLMLLRPDTKFYLRWTVVFVFCGVFEILCLASMPVIPRKDKSGGGMPTNSGGVRSSLERWLLPVPVRIREECRNLYQPLLTKKNKKQCVLFSGVKLVNDAKLKRKNNEIANRQPLGSFPWYCLGVFPIFQTAYINMLRFFIYDFAIIASAVGFLDVFVNFSTGQVDPVSGALCSKSPFIRWIAPGLVMQLLTNSKLANTHAFVKWALWAVHWAGPTRIWRWYATLFSPILNTFVAWLQWNVWMERENCYKARRNEARSRMSLYTSVRK